MKRMRVLLIGGLIAGSLAISAIAAWPWSSESPSPPFRVAMLGSRKTNDSLTISGGNLVITPPKPGLFFGTIKRPGEEERISYLVLLDFGNDSGVDPRCVVRAECTSEGKVTETRNSIDFGAKRIAACYHVQMNETHSAVEQEILTIGGKTIDVSKGRMFQVDLSAETISYSQLRVALPAIEQELSKTEDVEQLARSLDQIVRAAKESIRSGAAVASSI